MRCNRMTWFWYSIIALLCWSGSDLFSKIGCRGQEDKRSHLKMLTAVGIVMGLHCAYKVFFCGIPLSVSVIVQYLPVSALYILSMAIGYIGLRYIELSISSPICNSSGAVVAILTLITAGRSGVNNVQLLGVSFVSLGIIALSIVEAREDPSLREQRQSEGNYKYSKSFLALLIPILYCLLDALGTFADSLVLETLEEESANCAYELTFFVVGIVCLIYQLLRHEKFHLKLEAPKYIGAVFETAGQFAYIFAIGDSKHVMLSAPIISSYCVASVLWGRIFLKEKLSWKHYISISIVILGIILIGIYDI